VDWEASNTPWDKRWDKYFVPSDLELHWVSVTYSIVVSIGLAGLITVILVRILRSSLAKYSTQLQLDEVEESGWKALHGDVFRAPHRFMILSVLVGTGAQMLTTAMMVIVLGAIGFLSPAHGGSLTTAIVVIYILMGIVNGYTSQRVYIMMGGQRKRRNTLLSAFMLPGLIFSVWFIADIVLWSKKSSAGPSVGLMFALLGMWFGIMVPLVIIGSYLANRRAMGEFPVSTNQIPRLCPTVVWYMNPFLLTLASGLLPFGTIFNELFFMMSAMWSHHFFYLFGIVLVVFTLLVVIAAEVAIVLCYFQLFNEDYHWWWRPFYSAGVTVAYILIYALFFFSFTLDLSSSAASVFLYLGYTLIMAFVIFAILGTAGFYASLLFVNKIYSTIHID